MKKAKNNKKHQAPQTEEVRSRTNSKIDSTDSEKIDYISDSDSQSVDSHLLGSVSRARRQDDINQEFAKLMKVQKHLSKHDEQVNEDITKFKRMLVNHIENRILNSQKRFEETIQEEMEQFESRVNQMITNLRDEHYYQKKLASHSSKKPQMEKRFKYKPSLLTEMFRQSDYKTLYNMIVASLLALFLNLMASDYIEKNSLLDVETFVWCFKNLHLVVQLLVLIFAWGYLSIPYVIYYQKQNWSTIKACIVYFALQFVQMAFPCYLSQSIDLGFGTQMIILCEGARMSLKNHSYIRNKIMYGTKNSYQRYIPPSFVKKGLTDKDLKLPEINIGPFKQEVKRYSYFMLAPTLIYRDQYVKAPHCSKRTVIIEFFNFLMSILLGFILFRTFCKGPILELRDNLTLSGFVMGIFKLMMPSTFSLILLFFGLLHSWLNGFAELLRFPDRTFYLDWWTSSEFGQYYRKWNIVVHEFLYYYVYLDVQKLSKGRVGKGAAQLLTFGISAVLHEIILGFALGFFYPICFVLFTGPGILLIRQGQKFWKKSWVNIIFWMLMYIGASLMITLYLVEYYAREIITSEYVFERWGYLSFLIPRTLYLNL